SPTSSRNARYGLRRWSRWQTTSNRRASEVSRVTHVTSWRRVMTYANPHFLAETEWLEAHLGDADLRVIDCRIDMLPAEGGGLRFLPAPNAWKDQHIRGATFVDFHEDLSDRGHELLFMLPSAQQFSEVMSRHGVGDGTRVVLYDGFMNAWAARFWWMLRTYGFD